MNNPSSPADRDPIYALHPLQLRTIVARLARQGIDVPTAGALVEDGDTEITDQNHVGGAPFTRELADVAGVTAGSTVADVAAGLAGSARLLAAERGCRVVAVEKDPGRLSDARQLTTLVGLDDRVTIVAGDAESMDPLSGCDVLWGQGAWVHFADRARFFQRWCAALPPGGRVAIEDVALQRPPARNEADERLTLLAQQWQAHFSPVAHWVRDLEAAGCRVTFFADLSTRARHYLNRLADVSELWPDGTVTAAERNAWSFAHDLLGAETLSYFRLVAERR